jgi:hypothetical protein
MRRRILVATVTATAAVLGALLALAGPVAADPVERSILMDDQPLLYTSDAAELAALQRIKDLGVNIVKVSMVWALVAPDPTSTTYPQGFNATDPASYPPGAWSRYDRLVEMAQSIGLTVYFQLTAPAPAWATPPDPDPTYGHPFTYDPNPTMFGQFVQAVGTRYSGAYVPPALQTCTGTGGGGFTITTPGGLTVPVGNTGGETCTPATAAGGPLPAVHWWGLWNEPNEKGWLTPQVRTVRGHRELYAPALYRALADSGYAALLGTGHADDTILLGELASGGDTGDKPLPFLRALYCVDGRGRPLTGTAAAALACPTSGDRGSFVTANPVLFAATGFAYHPYSFDHSPATPVPHHPGLITLANLSRLTTTLDGALRAYREPTGMPLYLTEWGYKTDPPNPFVHTSLTQAATWLNEGEYMTYFMPRVRALAQFLLYDLPPDRQYPRGSFGYWVPFQSGLFFLNGQPKPSFFAFRLPLWIPRAIHGRSVAVWGELRPGPHTRSQSATLQFLGTGRSGRWRPLARVLSTNPEGFFLTHVSIPRPGAVRLAYAGALSRTVLIH